MTSSLAIYDYLIEMCQASIHIKWPNDILVNEFKICGILIENQLAGDQFSHAVIGIGLNVNQKEFGSISATSLSRETHQDHDLQEVLEGVLSHLEARYLQLRQGKEKMLAEDYVRHLYRLNELHTFRSGEELFKGEITGVDAYGRLRVLTHGQEKVYDIKEISFLELPV